ncbi:ABC transporter permease, partial [Candidatus Bathyarchaeota archaeon]|nr:ABC transporter permease [Candidatus Bathyarchaeota archaeon]
MFVDFVRLSLKALSERRTRAILTIIGIAIGPLVLVMMSSVVGSYSNYIVERVTSLGQNAIAVFPTENYQLDWEDLNYIRSIDTIMRAEPFYNTQGVLKRGNEELKVSIFAVDYDLLFEAIGSLKIGEGDIPSESNMIYSIIGRKVAFKDGERCFGLEDVLTVGIPKIEGGKIVGKKTVNVVVGAVLEEYGGALIVDPDSTVIVCFEAGSRILWVTRWVGVLVLVNEPA